MTQCTLIVGSPYLEKPKWSSRSPQKITTAQAIMRPTGHVGPSGTVAHLTTLWICHENILKSLEDFPSHQTNPDEPTYMDLQVPYPSNSIHVLRERKHVSSGRWKDSELHFWHRKRPHYRAKNAAPHRHDKKDFVNFFSADARMLSNQHQKSLAQQSLTITDHHWITSISFLSFLHFTHAFGAPILNAEPPLRTLPLWLSRLWMPPKHSGAGSLKGATSCHLAVEIE